MDNNTIQTQAWICPLCCDDHQGTRPCKPSDLIVRIMEMKEELAESERVKEHLLLQAQCHAMEARTQRNTVNEIGSLLGGVGDWGPIVAGVAAMKEKLAERDAELEQLKWVAEELIEVAALRGDNALPLPEDDPLLWTARMQTAWNELEEALTPEQPAKGGES